MVSFNLFPIFQELPPSEIYEEAGKLAPTYLSYAGMSALLVVSKFLIGTESVNMGNMISSSGLRALDLRV